MSSFFDRSQAIVAEGGTRGGTREDSQPCGKSFIADKLKCSKPVSAIPKRNQEIHARRSAAVERLKAQSQAAGVKRPVNYTKSQIAAEVKAGAKGGSSGKVKAESRSTATPAPGSTESLTANKRYFAMSGKQLKDELRNRGETPYNNGKALDNRGMAQKLEALDKKEQRPGQKLAADLLAAQAPTPAVAPTLKSTKGAAFFAKHLSDARGSNRAQMQAIAYAHDTGTPVETGWLGKARVTRLTPPSKSNPWGSARIEAVNPEPGYESRTVSLQMLGEKIAGATGGDNGYIPGHSLNPKVKAAWENSDLYKQSQSYGDPQARPAATANQLKGVSGSRKVILEAPTPAAGTNPARPQTIADQDARNAALANFTPPKNRTRSTKTPDQKGKVLTTAKVDITQPDQRAAFDQQEMERARRRAKDPNATPAQRQAAAADAIKWEAQAKKWRLAAVNAERKRVSTTQAELFGVETGSSLPLFAQPAAASVPASPKAAGGNIDKTPIKKIEVDGERYGRKGKIMRDSIAGVAEDGGNSRVFPLRRMVLNGFTAKDAEQVDIMSALWGLKGTSEASEFGKIANSDIEAVYNKASDQQKNKWAMDDDINPKGSFGGAKRVAEDLAARRKAAEQLAEEARRAKAQARKTSPAKSSGLDDLLDNLDSRSDSIGYRIDRLLKGGKFSAKKQSPGTRKVNCSPRSQECGSSCIPKSYNCNKGDLASASNRLKRLKREGGDDLQIQKAKNFIKDKAQPRREELAKAQAARARANQGSAPGISSTGLATLDPKTIKVDP